MELLDIKDVISEIKYRYNCTQKEIASIINVQPTYLSDVISGRVGFSDSLKEKIYEQYSDLFLLTGEGEMLKTEKKVETNIVQTVGDNNYGSPIAAGGNVNANTSISELISAQKQLLDHNTVLLEELRDQRKDHNDQINKFLELLKK